MSIFVRVWPPERPLGRTQGYDSSYREAHADNYEVSQAWIVEDLHAREIGLDEMESAVALVDWYVSEALRLQQAGRTDTKLLRAAKLLEWLQGQPDGKASISAILTHGPNALRTKASPKEALAILAAHGWTVEFSQRLRIIKTVGEVSR